MLKKTCQESTNIKKLHESKKVTDTTEGSGCNRDREQMDKVQFVKEHAKDPRKQKNHSSLIHKVVAAIGIENKRTIFKSTKAK